MTNLIPIGRFAQITHLSVKALRIYADEGLLQPKYVDPESGYRYYALAQSSTHPDDITYAGGFYDKEPLRHARAGTLVLLGDAAHPMSPFRGEGANMAMADALSFTDQLRIAERSHLEEALALYEQEMLQRTRKVVLASRQAAKEMHSRNRVSQVVRNAKLRIADKLLPLVQKE